MLVTIMGHALYQRLVFAGLTWYPIQLTQGELFFLLVIGKLLKVHPPLFHAHALLIRPFIGPLGKKNIGGGQHKKKAKQLAKLTDEARREYKLEQNRASAKRRKTSKDANKARIKDLEKKLQDHQAKIAKELRRMVMSETQMLDCQVRFLMKANEQFVASRIAQDKKWREWAAKADTGSPLPTFSPVVPLKSAALAYGPAYAVPLSEAMSIGTATEHTAVSGHLELVPVNIRI